MLPSIQSYTLPHNHIPANTTHWQADPSTAVLLVHDMQEHFARSFDQQAENQFDVAKNNIKTLTRAARQQDIPVVYTAQPPQQDSRDRQLLNDFWGPGLNDEASARIIKELEPQPQDTILTKWRYCAFFRTDLEDRMRNYGKNQLWITGVYSHIGCLTTALTAFMHGYQVFFVADAQADFSEEEHIQALNYVAGRCGQVISTEQLLQACNRSYSPSL
ncbi:isochorismatase family protein [uncultured Rothia sp.]|uniref:isochorismatase family protein n=1 Tax=uncultured Rothia sp. TaxID=316088 RepID=UPI003217EBC7